MNQLFHGKPLPPLSDFNLTIPYTSQVENLKPSYEKFKGRVSRTLSEQNLCFTSHQIPGIIVGQHLIMEEFLSSKLLLSCL